MRNYFFLMVVIGLVSSTEPAVAGTSTHGGDAVVCFSNKKAHDSVASRIAANRMSADPVDPLGAVDLNDITSTSLLDLYFIDSKNLVQLPGISFEQIVSDRMDELSRRSNFADQLQKIRNDELRDSDWHSVQNGVVEINDEEMSAFLPDNCLLLQIAHQRDLNGRAQVYLESRLADRLPPSHRAALTIHEWVLRYAYAHTSTVKPSPVVRDIVATLFSQSFTNVDDQETNLSWSKMFGNRSDFQPRAIVEFGQRKLSFRDGTVSIMGDLTTGTLAAPETFELNGKVLRASKDISFNRKTGRLVGGTFVESFNEDGVVYKSDSWLEFDYASNSAVARVSTGILSQSSRVENYLLRKDTGVIFHFNDKGTRTVVAATLDEPGLVDGTLMGKNGYFNTNAQGRLLEIQNSETDIHIDGLAPFPPQTFLTFDGYWASENPNNSLVNADRLRSATFLPKQETTYLGLKLMSGASLERATLYPGDDPSPKFLFRVGPNGPASGSADVLTRGTPQQTLSCRFSQNDPIITLYRDGQLAQCKPVADFKLKVAGAEYTFLAENDPFPVKFYANGALQTGNLKSNSWINGIPCSAERTEFTYGRAEFHPNQSLAGCWLFKNLNYRGKKYLAKYYIGFDPDGAVTGVSKPLGMK